MSAGETRDVRGWRAWLRWVLFSEALIWFLAFAGPGSRHAVRRRGDHGLIARWFVDAPSFWEAVVINAAVIHVFVAVVFVAARAVSRRRRRQTAYGSRSNGAEA